MFTTAALNNTLLNCFFIPKTNIVCIPNILLKDIINGKKANIRNNKIDCSYPSPNNISTIHSAKTNIKIEPIKLLPPNIKTILCRNLKASDFDLLAILLTYG